jgi:hypothetical protein
VLQAEVQEGQVLQAASVLRHRLQRHPMLCTNGVRGPGELLLGQHDLLCCKVLVLHRVGLLFGSSGQLLLGPGCNVLCAGTDMLRSSPKLLHGPDKLLHGSLSLSIQSEFETTLCDRVLRREPQTPGRVFFGLSVNSVKLLLDVCSREPVAPESEIEPFWASACQIG